MTPAYKTIPLKTLLLVLICSVRGLLTFHQIKTFFRYQLKVAEYESRVRSVQKQGKRLRNAKPPCLAPKIQSAFEQVAQEEILELWVSSGLNRRSLTRPIPIPRSLLHFLCETSSKSLFWTIIAYTIRGLSFEKGAPGLINPRGTVKCSWISEHFGLSLRSVKYARSWLIKNGWISKDSSTQWKLNRDGAYFVINLSWQRRDATGEDNGEPVTEGSSSTCEQVIDHHQGPADTPPQGRFPDSCAIGDHGGRGPENTSMVPETASQEISEGGESNGMCPDGQHTGQSPNGGLSTEVSDGNVTTSDTASVAPPRVVIPHGIAPLIRDKKDLLNRRSKDQKAVEATSGRSKQLKKPSLNNVVLDDLFCMQRMEELYRQAVSKGLVKNSEHSFLLWISASERAKHVTSGDKVKIFSGIVRKGLWANITQDEEDKARRMLHVHREQNGSFATERCRNTLLQSSTKVAMDMNRNSPRPTVAVNPTSPSSQSNHVQQQREMLQFLDSLTPSDRLLFEEGAKRNVSSVQLSFWHREEIRLDILLRYYSSHKNKLTSNPNGMQLND